MGQARSRHLGAPRRRQALCLVEGDDLGRVDRGIKSAETFGFKAPLEKWRALRDAIHLDVCARGFDPELNSFVESYGSKMLDASILLLPSVGFLPPDDPRVRGTLVAIERHLMRDGFVLRHDPREVEQQPIEGAFLACTLGWRTPMCWRASSTRRRTLFNRVVASRQRSRPPGRRIRYGRPPPDRQLSAGADAYRADQHRVQSLRARKQSTEKPAMQRSK